MVALMAMVKIENTSLPEPRCEFQMSLIHKGIDEDF